MGSIIRSLRQASPRRWAVYFVVYVVAGGFLQLTAPYTRIAHFAHDWQVLSIYGVFLVSLSIVVRDRPWHTQYAYAIAAIAPVDVVGFALGTSIAYPNNLIERIVGPRSFTLAFVLVASWIPVIGNIVVTRLEGLLGTRRFADRTNGILVRPQALGLRTIETTMADGERPLPPAWQ